MSGCSFYLTNSVENTNSLVDWCANQCFVPLHTLINLTGSKAVRVFHVDSQLQRFEEVAIDRAFEWTLTKVAEVALALILVIPGTICGVILKGAVWLCDEEFAQSMQILEKSRLFHMGQGETKIGSEDRLTRLSSDVFSQKICPWLTLGDLARLQGASRAIWQRLHSHQRAVILEYRKNLRGVTVHPSTHSYASLIADCLLHAEKFHYNSHLLTDSEENQIKFTALFGGFTRILRLPLFEMKGNVSYREIEQFAHSPDFRNKPPVFRLRIEWGGVLQEMIMIKYTLFVPNEYWRELRQAGLIQHVQPDGIWHDYLLLRLSSVASDPRWKCNDARNPDCLPSHLRRDLGYKQGPFADAITRISVVAGTLDFEKNRLQRLLKGERVGLFEQKRDKPSYILGSGVPKIYAVSNRIFKDIPFALGDLSLEEMTRTMHPDTHVMAVSEAGARGVRFAEDPSKEVVDIITFWPEKP